MRRSLDVLKPFEVLIVPLCTLKILLCVYTHFSEIIRIFCKLFFVLKIFLFAFVAISQFIIVVYDLIPLFLHFGIFSHKIFFLFFICWGRIGAQIQGQLRWMMHFRASLTCKVPTYDSQKLQQCMLIFVCWLRVPFQKKLSFTQ